ncbi:TonB-dependent receptor [Sphingobium sufflavum]|uniref:TonB-dependent receptor n=1 Tax=Sphingobium sufflavum TaxID=1129547 RepID=UPI001F46F4DC|nr:TonB-dependent receptor [Sphingobium sufflavum]MCE7796680.1 TonB-dependent receptor [Sphingobium sufflavum]
MKKIAVLAALSGASIMVMTAATPVMAQQSGATVAEDIIVTARRKDETAQDVPLVVNAVTADTLQKLNIRDFRDISTVVPGLQLSTNANGIGTTSSVRGVNYDVNASGNNGTIEFYLNDAPLASGILFQSMFDVGQIEVLRGPQGTLRGRASPSGSITVTSHRPNLQELGGYVSANINDLHGANLNGALNIPIIKDVLAIRVAGIVEKNEGNRIRSINDPAFVPYNRFSAFASYQGMVVNSRIFDQRESVNVVDGTQPASPVTIRAEDRRGVTDAPRRIRQKFDIYNWQGEYRFAGQKVNYVGSYTKQHLVSFQPSDTGDFFGAAYPSSPLNFQTFGQATDTYSMQESHELRLSSDEQLFGMVDYVVGGFVNRLESPTNLTTQTPFFAAFAPSPAAATPTSCLAPTTCSSIITTPITRGGRTIERSLFGNLTVHLGDATEISGGLRYINYKSYAFLTINGAMIPDAKEDVNFNTVIYSGSVKHNFTENLMAYASIGSSWRPGLSVTGDFSLNRTALENSFLILSPEKSKSYEIGFKSSFLDKRLRLNVSAFHQDFQNYPFRVPGSGVFYVSNDLSRTGPVDSVKSFNFVGAVPVKVDGVEGELAFRASDAWNFGVQASYARGKVQNGLVPCNDYSPRDGVPDSNSSVPTVQGIRTATGGDNISGCRTNVRSSYAPLFSANLQSEYSLPVSGSADGYLRGLVTYYGDSQNDPTNAVDDVKAYALVNLYAGVRDNSGAWEVSIYGKNIFNTQRVLSRSSTALTTSYATALGGQTGTTSYREISMTAPQEFGVNLRYAFGSR